VTGKFTEEGNTLYYVEKIVQVLGTEIFGDLDRWKSTLLRHKGERVKLIK